MIDKPKDGGPAFARPAGHKIPIRVSSETNSEEQQGMSLRDYFAAKALEGMLHYGYHQGMSVDSVADGAYQFADRMLKQGGHLEC